VEVSPLKSPSHPHLHLHLHLHLISAPTNPSTGGKHFSKNLRPLDADGNELGMWGEGAEPAEASEEEESSEEESDEDTGPKPELTREERRAAAKAKKEAAIAKKKGAPQPGDMPSSSEEEEEEEESEEDDMPANPNHSKAARSQAAAAPVSVEEAAEGMKAMGLAAKAKKPVGELSRREREALQAQQAKERYQKLHEAGKTDEAKADLARLKLIREKREAEAARKQVCLLFLFLSGGFGRREGHMLTIAG